MLDHVVYCDGILVNLDKIAIILDLTPPNTINKFRETLEHIGYYRKFIKGYAEVTASMENLLKKNVKFQWTEIYKESLDTLKNKMDTTPILVFID